jgi:pyruvate dehydrogenase E1 component alpha subunit
VPEDAHDLPIAIPVATQIPHAVGLACATREAAARAPDGEGPTLIECVTYRLAVHTTADDPSKYRSEEEVEAWRRRDPIPRLQNHMKTRELLTDAQIDALEDEVKGEIEDAWTETQAEMERLDNPRSSPRRTAHRPR